MTSFPSSPVSPSADPGANPSPSPGVNVPAPTAFNARVLYTAAGFAALVVIAAVVTGIGSTPDNKATIFKWAVVAASGVLATALAAMGYQTGQLFKNVVPAGFLPAIQAVAQMQSAPAAREIQATPLRQATLGITDAPGAPRLDPNAPNDPAGWTAATAKTPGAFGSPGVPMLAALLLLPLLALMSGGCTGTSAAFKAGAPAGVGAVVEDMKDYTKGADWDSDHNGVIDATERANQAGEEALTANLAASVADPKALTVEGVEAAWRPVEPLWRHYVATDATLETPDDRKTRTDTGDGLNRLIQAEKDRQAALKSSLGLSAIFGGSAPPATQPAK